ncbi:MAG: hypothetical protein Q8R34_01640 [bacterium]|nr:hypothetical protein [bacterium]
MEKGFRTFQCFECLTKLKFPVSEKDYGEIKVVRCPKCRALARVEIPYPTNEPDPFSPDFLKDIFGDFSKGNKK